MIQGLIIASLFLSRQVDTSAPPSVSVAPLVSGVTAQLSLSSSEVLWAFARADGWQGNYDRWPGRFDFEAGSWSVALVGCDFKVRPLTPLELKAFGAPDGSNIAGSAKALLRYSGALGGSAIATSCAGMRCELQPLIDPTRNAGGETPIQLRLKGDAVAGVVFNVAIGSNKPLRYTTNDSGVVNIPHSAGKYKVWVQWLDKSVLWSTSLTYEVPR